MTRNVKNDNIFLSTKFHLDIMQFIKVILNKPFFLLKALNPGLKLLKIILFSCLISLAFDT